MKTSDLIAKLQDLLAKHGDLPVATDDSDYEVCEAEAVYVQTEKDGYYYDLNGQRAWGDVVVLK